MNNLKLVFSNLKAVGVVKEEEEERDTPWYPEDPIPEDDDIAREQIKGDLFGGVTFETGRFDNNENALVSFLSSDILVSLSQLSHENDILDVQN